MNRYKLEPATNKFTVTFRYTEAGSNRVWAFDEACQSQAVRYKIGEFATRPMVLQSTNTAGRSSFIGLSEKDANAIVAALKKK
jgi:hypothetical protein